MMIETRRGSRAELAMKDLIERLLREHDLSAFAFTHRVRIDERAVPHSHPTLTLSTRFMVRTVDGVLADFLHEQLHWFVAEHRPEARRAARQWREMFGALPRRRHGGARTRRSTRLHLTVNWLEYEALACVLGRTRATETIAAKADGKIYPWVYRQVLDRHRPIGHVLREVGLTETLPVDDAT